MTRAYGKLLLLAVAMATAAPVSGCKKLFMNKATDCNNLRVVYNQRIETVKAASAKLQSSDAPADIEALAKAMDDAGHAITAVDISDDKLKDLAKRSATSWERAAKDVRAIKGAETKQNQKSFNKAKGALDKQDAETEKLVGELSSYCTS